MSQKTRMVEKVLLCLRFRQLLKSRAVHSLRVHRKNSSKNFNSIKPLLMEKVQFWTSKTVNFTQQTCHWHNTCLRKTILGKWYLERTPITKDVSLWNNIQAIRQTSIWIDHPKLGSEVVKEYKTDHRKAQVWFKNLFKWLKGLVLRLRLKIRSTTLVSMVTSKKIIKQHQRNSGLRLKKTETSVKLHRSREKARRPPMISETNLLRTIAMRSRYQLKLSTLINRLTSSQILRCLSNSSLPASARPWATMVRHQLPTSPSTRIER